MHGFRNHGPLCWETLAEIKKLVPRNECLSSSRVPSKTFRATFCFNVENSRLNHRVMHKFLAREREMKLTWIMKSNFVYEFGILLRKRRKRYRKGRAKEKEGKGITICTELKQKYLSTILLCAHKHCFLYMYYWRKKYYGFCNKLQSIFN